MLCFAGAWSGKLLGRDEVDMERWIAGMWYLGGSVGSGCRHQSCEEMTTTRQKNDAFKLSASLKICQILNVWQLGMDGDFVELPDPNADPSYEPSAQEVEEYAEWLGADPRTDRDLFWIARDALKAPIPPGWKLYQKKDGTGEPFYFNSKTGESLWDHPQDQHFKELFAEEKRKKMAGGGSSATKSRPPAAFGTKSSAPKPLLSSAAPMSLGPLKSSKPGGTGYSGGFGSGSTSRELAALQAEQSQRMDEERRNFETRLEEEMRILRAKGESEKNQAQMRMDDEMQTLRENHRKRMDSLRTSNQVEQENLEKLQSQLQTKKRNLENELNELKQKLEKETVDAEIQHNKNIKQLRQEHEQDLEAEKKKLAAKLADVKKQGEKEIADEKERHEKEMKALKEANKSDESEAERLRKEGELQSAQLDAMRKEFETKKKKFAQEQEEEIEKINEEHREKLNELKKKNNRELSQSQRDELDDIQTDFESQKSKLIQDNKKELEKIKANHAKEIERLNKEHEKKIAQLKSDHDAQISKLERETSESPKRGKKRHVSKAKATLGSEDEDELDDLKDTLERKKRELESQFKLEIEQMKLEHEKNMAQQRDKLSKEVDTKAIDRLKAKQESEIEHIKVGYEEEIERLAEDHRRNLERQTARWNRELEQARRDFEDKKEDLQYESTTKTRRRTPRMRTYNDIPISIAPIKRSVFLMVSPPFGYSYSDEVYDPRRLDQPSFAQHPYADSRFQMPFSRISEIPPSQIAGPEVDERAAQRSREMNYKLKKLHSKLESTTDSIVESLKDSSGDTNKNCQNIKNLASEQNKAMSQLSLDFQQQASQLTRSFQNMIADVEGSFRAAITALQTQRQSVMIAPPPQYAMPMQVVAPPSYQDFDPRRFSSHARRIRHRSPDNEIDSPTEAQKRLKKWREERKKTKAGAARTTRAFQEMRQMYRDESP